MKNLLGVCCLALAPTAPGPVSWRIWSRTYAWIFLDTVNTVAEKIELL